MKIRILDGLLDIKQIRIYKGEKEIADEEEYYKNKAQNMFKQLIGEDEKNEYSFMKHPSALTCLGVKPTNPKAEIKEGYVRASYDLKITPADLDCLFNRVKRLH